MNLQQSYEIMYQDTLVGFITSSGFVSLTGRLPYDLYLEECEGDSDIDTRRMNLDNFRSWCADRVLPLDREYAVQILNACAFSQAVSESDLSEVALAYNCLSLRDSYWVRKSRSEEWDRLNLFDNFTSNACVSIALEGKSQFIADPFLIAADCSTDGVFPKAWVRRQDGLYLYKGDRRDSVVKEVEASAMLQYLGLAPLDYHYEEWKGQCVSASACFTSKSVGCVSAESYSWNQDLVSAVEYFKQDFLKLILATYLVGNTDCHWRNWGFLFEYGQLIGMIPIFDFNHAFEASKDSLCLPYAVLGRSIRQLDAAREAAIQLGFVPKEVSFEQFKYGEYVQKKLSRLSV